MINVTVRYFAILREQRAETEETLATDATDAAALYRELQAKYAFTLPQDRLRVAVNGAFQPWPAPIKDGDALVFIPPVAGG